MNPENQNQKNTEKPGATPQPPAGVFEDSHTYQYSQINHSAPPQPPNNALPATDTQPLNKIPINSKIGSPMNWLVGLGILVTYFVLVAVLSEDAWKIFIAVYWPVVTALLGMHVKRINRSEDRALNDQSRTLMVALMASNVVVAQAVYYFALKKQKPAIAHSAVRLGWKMFGMWLIVAVVFFGSTILSSWGLQHASKFNEGLQKISKEGHAMVELAQQSTLDMYEVKRRCQNVVGHVHELKKIPAHPDKQIQSMITEGENEIEQAGNKCARAVELNDRYLMEEAGSHMKKGVNALQSAVKAHNES